LYTVFVLLRRTKVGGDEARLDGADATRSRDISQN
jgi:hypothetical protein